MHCGNAVLASPILKNTIVQKYNSIKFARCSTVICLTTGANYIWRVLDYDLLANQNGDTEHFNRRICQKLVFSPIKNFTHTFCCFPLDWYIARLVRSPRCSVRHLRPPPLLSTYVLPVALHLRPSCCSPPTSLVPAIHKGYKAKLKQN